MSEKLFWVKIADRKRTSDKAYHMKENHIDTYNNEFRGTTEREKSKNIYVPTLRALNQSISG